MAAKSSSKYSHSLRFRLFFEKEIALGPGKAELLRLIRETGSISEAARGMKMSYMRAWSLIQTMNRCFSEPVVQTERGGSKRGGARLTATGEKLLELYATLEKECQRASQVTVNEIARLLKKGG